MNKSEIAERAAREMLSKRNFIGLADVPELAKGVERAIAESQAPQPEIGELMKLEAREWRDSSGKEIKGAMWVRRSDVAQLFNGGITDTQAPRSRVCIHCGEESWAHCRFHEPAHCKVECAQAHHDPILATEKYELGPPKGNENV